jgi:hypothetical protein
MRYLKATLKDGSTVTAAFDKLANVGKYVAQVFNGQKPFNVWSKTGDTLPSGEPGVLRTREMISGDFIARIVETNEGGTPIAVIPRGERGRWTVPQNSAIPELVAGTVYPKHRSQRSGRDYVIVKAADNESSPRTGEVRFYIGDLGLTTLTPEPQDADEDTDQPTEQLRASALRT